MKRTKLTVPQLSRQWGVSTNKVVAFIRSGELRATNLATSTAGRPRYAIDLADVESFERARQVMPASSAPIAIGRRRQTASVKNFF